MSYTFTVSLDNDDRRLDRTLRSIWKNITLGEIMKAIRKGDVRVNSKRVRQPGTHIYSGDELVVPWALNESSCHPHGSWGNIKVIYHGTNVLILNKPAGILVQPDTPNGDSVISRVHAMIGSNIPAAVHRLDRNTSGVLAVALHGDSLRALEDLFRNRNVRKSYLAVVVGKAHDVIIDAPLLKDCNNNIVSVSENGLNAVTKCSCIASDGIFSLVRLELLTGRTHQARVHLAHVHNPILGDRKYGSFQANRLMKNISRPLLHAYELEFFNDLHSSLSEIEGKLFRAELPDDFINFIALRGFDFHEI